MSNNPYPHYQTPQPVKYANVGESQPMYPSYQQSQQQYSAQSQVMEGRKEPLQYFVDAYHLVRNNISVLFKIIVVYILSFVTFLFGLIAFTGTYLYLFIKDWDKIKHFLKIEHKHAQELQELQDTTGIQVIEDHQDFGVTGISQHDQAVLLIGTALLINFFVIYGGWLTNYFIGSIYNAHQRFHYQGYEFSNNSPANPSSLRGALRTYSLYLLIVLTSPIWIAFFPITILFLAPRLFLTPLTIVIEDTGVCSALSRSWKITRGSWCRSVMFWCLQGAVLSLLQLSVFLVAHIMDDDYVDEKHQWHIRENMAFITMVWICFSGVLAKLWVLCGAVAKVYFYIDHAKFHAAKTSAFSVESSYPTYNRYDGSGYNSVPVHSYQETVTTTVNVVPDSQTKVAPQYVQVYKQ